MAGVFLSYRRNDSGGWAGRLRDHLALRYGEDRVWQDVDNLTVGADYLPQSSRTSPRPTPFSSSSARTGSMNSHRAGQDAGNPKDVLRTEIVHALKKKSVSSDSLAARQCPPPEICPAP